MPIRVVLIGDQSAAIGEHLAALPAAFDLQLAGAFDERVSADRALRDAVPDAVIIADHDSNGWAFDLLGSLAPSERPSAIVVISAREEEAVRAFALQATDFVPMPVQLDRLRDAMLRARQQVLQAALLRTADELQRLLGEVGTVEELRDVYAGAGGRSSGYAASASTTGSWSTRPAGVDVLGRPWEPPKAPMPSFGESAVAAPRRSRSTDGSVLDLSVAPIRGASGVSSDGRPRRVLVRDGRRTRFVPLTEVDWFEADGNYIVVHSGAERFRTRGTISAIEATLDARQFVRIHRGRVVNMDRVRELSPLPGGDGLLVLADGSTLRLSRTYRSRVR